jgi:hypothetical protein
MSQGSCVAARDGVAPPASSPPRASVTVAARASSHLLVCLSRGLSVIVESDLPFGKLVVVPRRTPVARLARALYPDPLPCRALRFGVPAVGPMSEV